MAEAGSISIEVKMRVSEETARACVTMLNAYLRDHPEVRVVASRRLDGPECEIRLAGGVRG